VRKALRTGVETGARLPCPKNGFAPPQGAACLFSALFSPESGLKPYFTSKTPRKTSVLDKLTEPLCAFTLPKANLLCPLTSFLNEWEIMVEVPVDCGKVFIDTDLVDG
jgi:hypothetical protein